MGCIRDDREDEYKNLVKDFVAWSERNNLQLNTSKTKELVIGFGKSRPHPCPVLIRDDEVEKVPRGVAGQRAGLGMQHRPPVQEGPE